MHDLNIADLGILFDGYYGTYIQGQCLKMLEEIFNPYLCLTDIVPIIWQQNCIRFLKVAKKQSLTLPLLILNEMFDSKRDAEFYSIH